LIKKNAAQTLSSSRLHNLPEQDTMYLLHPPLVGPAVANQASCHLRKNQAVIATIKQAEISRMRWLKVRKIIASFLTKRLAKKVNDVDWSAYWYPMLFILWSFSKSGPTSVL